MANPISIRLSDVERRALDREAELRGVPISKIVRGALRAHLGLDEDVAATAQDERLDDLEKRLGRLEGMAGL